MASTKTVRVKFGHDDEPAEVSESLPAKSQMGFTTMSRVVVDVTKIGHHNGPIMLPEGLTTQQAIKALERRIQYEEYGDQPFTINAEWDVFIYEGAYALDAVLTEKFGWALAETVHIKTPMGEWDEPPTLLNIPISDGVVKQVPWGRFRVPGIDGFIECSIKHVGGGGMFGPPGKSLFRLTGEVKRKDEPVIKELVEAISAKLAEYRIYRNKVFRLRLKDTDGDWLAEPEINFLTPNPAMETELVLADDIREAVEVSLFTPIERSDDCRALGIPLKRGVLLAGQYGTGKTMIGSVAALKAKANGWTYIVAEGIEDLPDIIRLARQYQPCIVFHEDIDRLMHDNRSAGMDHVLNVIDGVESKNAEVMIVMTSNDMESINPALMRPGRLDAVIVVSPPDAAAAERLARQYARGLIADDEPLTESRTLLAGKISSVIREVVERSKLAAIAHTPKGKELRVTDAMLVKTVQNMEHHIAAASPRPEDRRSERVKAASLLAEAIRKANPGSGIVAAASIVTDDHAFPETDGRSWEEREDIATEMEKIEAAVAGERPLG